MTTTPPGRVHRTCPALSSIVSVEPPEQLPITRCPARFATDWPQATDKWEGRRGHEQTWCAQHRRDAAIFIARAVSGAELPLQYPADLLTSWGTEMENLILGWYVLVATGSVLLLTLFGSLQYFGTLVAPGAWHGGRSAGSSQISARCASATLPWHLLMALAFTDALRPVHVFIIAGIAGLVRPSDLAMRSALVAETMPTDHFISAMGASRTTSDSARTVGALVPRTRRGTDQNLVVKPDMKLRVRRSISFWRGSLNPGRRHWATLRTTSSRS